MNYFKHKIIVGNEKHLIVLPEEIEIGMLQDIAYHFSDMAVIGKAQESLDVKIDGRKQPLSEAHKLAISIGKSRSYQQNITGKKRDKRRIWSLKEENRLIKMREKKWSYKKIAVKLNKTLQQIKDKIKNMTMNDRWPGQKAKETKRIPKSLLR